MHINIKMYIGINTFQKTYVESKYHEQLYENHCAESRIADDQEGTYLFTCYYRMCGFIIIKYAYIKYT